MDRKKETSRRSKCIAARVQYVGKLPTGFLFFCIRDVKGPRGRHVGNVKHSCKPANLFIIPHLLVST